ncbi:MAG: hypothetical protein U9Q81_22670 [Pseudomonadota bacterium]|nr:hypothetical protein [Pseudomonadota bacterium]
MQNEQDNVIRYKWNPRTETGFRLRFDIQKAKGRRHNSFRVEDWTNHIVMNEWGCDSLDEALGVLRHFFDIDVGRERHRIEERFPLRVQ